MANVRTFEEREGRMEDVLGLKVNLDRDITIEFAPAQ